VTDALSARLDELETRVAFQDDLLATLDRNVAEYDRALRAMSIELEQVRRTLEGLRASLAHDPRDEPPPPHY
jgi:SlyX protein